MTILITDGDKPLGGWPDDLEECACGRTYEPVDSNGEDVDMCPTCADDAAEAAYERQVEAFYGGGEPVTVDEIHRAAWEEKQRLR